MDATSRWALPLLFAGQAQKELFHNEALTLVDALLHGAVESAELIVPPVDAEPGQCWIVAAGGTGEWAGHDGAVAMQSEGGWRFMTPRAGLGMWVVDRNVAFFHDGVQWLEAPVRADGLYLGGDHVVGERQGAIGDPAGGAVVDAEGRATIVAILQALRSHGLIAM